MEMTDTYICNFALGTSHVLQASVGSLKNWQGGLLPWVARHVH